MKKFLQRWYGDDCPSWSWPATAGALALLAIYGLPALGRALQ